MPRGIYLKTEKHKRNLSKSLKGRHLSISTEFKKGQHVSKSTEFKKGQKGWNYKLTGDDYKKFYKNGFGGLFEKGIIPHNKGKFSPHRVWKAQLRDCYKMFCWRLKVFQRDHFTCQECGIRGRG